MRSTVVRGRFVDQHGVPIEDVVRFVPSKIWIEEEDATFPTFAPEVALVNGCFEAELTCTDTHPYGPWHYTVHCPIGTWAIHIEGTEPLLLRDLLPHQATKNT